MIFQVGQTVGDYRIIAIVGRGGMGDVYQIEHIITRRLEAMKVLSGDHSAEQTDRFLREIQVQASLNHPNIAAVHTAFRLGSDLALVMELLDGESLAAILEKKRVPLPIAISYVCQVLAALEYAHHRGVIHRDIAPANIVLTSSAGIKLTDFGLAKRQSDMRVTQSGAFIGSPHYMSPEQARDGGAVDARSDIYSTGVVLYELAIGRKPFDSDNIFDLLCSQVQKQPIAPIDLYPTLPRALNDIILKALAKDPAARFQSAHEFQIALQPFGLSREHVGAPPVNSLNQQVYLAAAALFQRAVSMVRPLVHPGRLRQILLGFISAATVMLICVGAWWYASRPTPSAPDPYITHPVPPAIVQIQRQPHDHDHHTDKASPPNSRSFPRKAPKQPGSNPQQRASSGALGTSPDQATVDVERETPRQPANEPAEPNITPHTSRARTDSAFPSRAPGKLRRALGKILHSL